MTTDAKNRLLQRIIIDPRIMVGKPVIKGTRIPVELIMRLIAQRIPEQEILDDYPHLTKEDLQAVLVYASELLANEEVYPLMPGETTDV